MFHHTQRPLLSENVRSPQGCHGSMRRVSQGAHAIPVQSPPRWGRFSSSVSVSAWMNQEDSCASTVPGVAARAATSRKDFGRCRSCASSRILIACADTGRHADLEVGVPAGAPSQPQGYGRRPGRPDCRRGRQRDRRRHLRIVRSACQGIQTVTFGIRHLALWDTA